jgi:hypothetical protein
MGSDPDRADPPSEEGNSAEYWEAPGGRVVTLISMAKAAITRSSADVGENAEVRLG